jgi:translation initiation factor 1
VCPPTRSLSPEKQEAHIRREKKGRGGKTVTVVRNLRLTQVDLKALGRHLRQTCGSGGTVKDGTIEIQGDHRERVAEALRGMGYRCKFTGG